MLLIDAHVHIYDCYDLDKYFNSAYSNFKSAAENLGHADDFTGILLLAESSKDIWFQHLWNYANGIELPDGRTSRNWNFYHTAENCSLKATSGKSKSLILIAGRQIVSSEGLEALAIGTTNTFEDGETIYDIIEKINENDSLPILPWGVGKWFGNRGKIVEDIINIYYTSIYLGDNKNRPYFWPEPRLFRLAKQRGISIFPGSDPLPFAGEHCKVGSFGFSLNARLLDERPTIALKDWILNPTMQFQPYGKLEHVFPFFKNQIALRFSS
jgi:hypothetical protein